MFRYTLPSGTFVFSNLPLGTNTEGLVAAPEIESPFEPYIHLVFTYILFLFLFIYQLLKTQISLAGGFGTWWNEIRGIQPRPVHVADGSPEFYDCFWRRFRQEIRHERRIWM
ncbi:unnamed protein product [Hermetia illucens]|uniref:Uncharacterized protein n=1 Tax=Hermetia illucens TaxID=343691 RepID=A0A7R8V867_HERIL|nr:uncharacterized protein LOC119661025 isoform X2 [Hermetia illucens]CAD7093928.1 unnamed protein product [Hermetia illucens]CAD7093929.1 unnamed protein product [Hermetia illucens]CAD7093930.1 unnamed protein product [Hermetia illucens]